MMMLHFRFRVDPSVAGGRSLLAQSGNGVASVACRKSTAGGVHMPRDVAPLYAQAAIASDELE